jgi:hypothetical protein
VETIIEMSLDRYDAFVDKCDRSSRDYEILKNGVIILRPKEDHFERIVEIRCSVQEAKGLLDLASKSCLTPSRTSKKRSLPHARARNVTTSVPLISILVPNSLFFAISLFHVLKY